MRKEIGKKYLLRWGEKYSAMLVDMFARICITRPDIFDINYSDYLTFIVNRQTVKAYYSDKALAEINDKLGKYFLETKRIRTVLTAYEKRISKYNDFERLFQHNVSRASNMKLLSLFRQYVNFTEEGFALFRMTRAESEIGPSMRIRNILAKYYNGNEIEEKFQTLCQSSELDIIGRERIAWLKLVEKDWDKSLALDHIYKFAASYVNIYDIEYLLSILEKKFRIDKPKLNEIRTEINSAGRQKANIKKQQAEIYAKCKNDKDLIIFSQMIQKFGIYRFDLKYAWAGCELHILEFFKEISKRLNINLIDFFELYLVDDIINFFVSGRVLTRKELSERSKCIFIHVEKNKYLKYFGDKALKEVAKIENVQADSHTLKGMTAFPGHVKGVVRIVHSTDINKITELAKKISKGDILVSEGTQPSMVVLMKKVGAILTEVGGITSHAAIVSREFRKPCIVGIRNLVKVLKDGDLVEVDANKGVVRKIR